MTCGQAASLFRSGWKLVPVNEVVPKAKPVEHAVCVKAEADAKARRKAYQREWVKKKREREKVRPA